MEKDSVAQADLGKGQERRGGKVGIGLELRLRFGDLLLKEAHRFRPDWAATISGALELRFAGRTKNAVVANFSGAAWQDVLKKPMDEFDAGKRHVTKLLTSVVAIVKTNVAMLNRSQTAVGNGDAENVACKIIENLISTAHMLGMHNPFFLPD